MLLHRRIMLCHLFHTCKALHPRSVVSRSLFQERVILDSLLALFHKPALVNRWECHRVWYLRPLSYLVVVLAIPRPMDRLRIRKPSYLLLPKQVLEAGVQLPLKHQSFRITQVDLCKSLTRHLSTSLAVAMILNQRPRLSFLNPRPPHRPILPFTKALLLSSLYRHQEDVEDIRQAVVVVLAQQSPLNYRHRFRSVLPVVGAAEPGGVGEAEARARAVAAAAALLRRLKPS